MAIKIIKKASAKQVAAAHVVSIDKILASHNSRIFELAEPIKPIINIKIDAYGKPNVKTINMGIQYEHYSSWIHFDLKDLFWQIQSAYDPFNNQQYDEEYYYALYSFRLYFKDRNTDEVTSWEFDGIDFQIPRQLTLNPSSYEITLVIQEIHGDDDEGNLPDDYSPFEIKEQDSKHETFVTYSWFGEVTPTYFIPALLEGIEEIAVADTSQTRALIKPAIDCRLADDGYFELINHTDTSLGMYNDNFIRYLRFNPGNITAHLNEFWVFAIYKQNDLLVSVPFEQTQAGAYDDISQPLISWIPSEVYNHPGEWRIMIAAISKNYRTENPEDNDYTDMFYRFLSDKITMTVDPGFVDDLKLMRNADEQYYVSNFITADNQVIIGSENAILRGGK